MMDVTGFFEKMLVSSRIFKNKEVLRHSYTPENLPHRDEQIESLASILVSALKGETPSNVMIYGKTGTGKTATVRFVGRELEKTGERLNIPCYVCYINCEIIDTQYRVLATLARMFDRNIPMTGWPTDQVYSEFKMAVDSKDQTLIIVLDEIDKLVRKGDEILYNLSRINSELSRARVSLIGISNDVRFTEYLDPRVRSSLGEEEIVFPPYDANQLRDILAQRAEMAFYDGVLDDSVIPLCAALAAQEHGDARKALDLLRVSGEIAEKENSEVVEARHVRMAIDKIENDHVMEVIRTLPTQSKLILFGMVLLSRRGSREFTTGEVYDVYRQLCRRVGMDVLTQRRISDLISELDLLGIVNTVIVSKGRYGRTREITLNVSRDVIASVVLEDFRLRTLSKVDLQYQAKLDSITSQV